MDSGGKAGAVRFPNGPRNAREQRSGRLELAEALEGAPGSLSEVAERDPPQLQEEQYPKGPSLRKTAETAGARWNRGMGEAAKGQVFRTTCGRGACLS